jgi:hypothetical protein
LTINGVVIAVTDYRDHTSFAIQCLADNDKTPAFRFVALLHANYGSFTQLKAMATFKDITVYSDNCRGKAGYGKREIYMKATHRLWRAAMQLSLWTGDF